MAESRFDIVIFGATGFTGQFVVEEVARVSEEEGLTWAVAGRSMDKLQKVLTQASKMTGKELEEKTILIADTSNYESLLEMAKKAKVILNCVGPYRFYGEQVVKASIEGGASHLDISGEPQYMEKMQLMYHGKAKESKVYVVSACGFDSIPAEYGILHALQKFDGQVNSVESYMEFHTGPEGAAINSGTLESALYGFLHAGELKSLRKSLFPEALPSFKHKITKRSAFFKSDVINKWCTTFLGSDKSVIYRTQQYNHLEGKTKPVRYITNILVKKTRKDDFFKILLTLSPSCKV
ncbi:hypothetical protein FSP39_015091 [Pinctada imbricata]|uniref:Saccharopine dehydrogenase NADP binding domain-containing protein n=1 Tax=Pinctada imbricata TaxID=66713 RepID=A0AA89C3K5_PINIB|nr:hypothetical protein FSP39_015091 [Pinctada imbricata]